MMMLSKIRQTKLGKFIFAAGCLFPVGIVFLIMLLFVYVDIHEKWIKDWTSSSFEMEKNTVETDFYFESAVIEDEKKVTIFGTKNRLRSDNNKPVVLQTTDGGKNWKKTEIDLDFQATSFDRIDDCVYMVGSIDSGDSAISPVYVPNGNFEKWEYVGMAESPKLGLYYLNKDESSEKIALLERNAHQEYFDERLCSSDGRMYAHNDRNWIICGNNKTKEVRILHKLGNEYRVHSRFSYKWHWGIGDVYDLEPSDFYAKDDVMAGILQFQVSALKMIHYLYYSIDGGKTWQNEKIPVFAFERLAVTEDKIVVLGFDQFYKQKRGEATILTIPLPKK